MQVIRTAFRRWRTQGMMKQGAALAFYAVLALAPFLFLLSALTESVFGVRTMEALLVQNVGRFAGASSAQLVQQMAAPYRASANPVITVIGLLVFVFAATNFFVEVSEAFDVIARRQSRSSGWIGFFRHHVKAFFLILLTGFLMAVFFFTTTGVSNLQEFLSRQSGAPLWFLYFLNFVLLFTVATLLFALVYRYLPSEPLSVRHAVTGALVTTVFLVAGEYALGWVFGKGLIGSYGIAGGIIAFLTWVYYSSMLFLFGAEVAYALPED
ncbi:MAG TPA: YihY/virulence factor BrkB family protein [Candidatus Paceibacterota bacterium]|nr:YihY/virulence factor BrkB family protein [Candidatus Paceibacterota bacterium]